VLQQPYDVEVGAGTMHPETFLRVLGRMLTAWGTSNPVVGPRRSLWREPNRFISTRSLGHPQTFARRCAGSLPEEPGAIGINLKTTTFDLKRTTGIPNPRRLGIGWQVLLDGLEITQFTYFQQSGGIDLDPSPSSHLRPRTYLRIPPGVESVYDLRWSRINLWRHPANGRAAFSEYSFDRSDAPSIRSDLNCMKTGQRTS